MPGFSIGGGAELLKRLRRPPAPQGSFVLPVQAMLQSVFGALAHEFTNWFPQSGDIS